MTRKDFPNRGNRQNRTTVEVRNLRQKPGQETRTEDVRWDWTTIYKMLKTKEFLQIVEEYRVSIRKQKSYFDCLEPGFRMARREERKGSHYPAIAFLETTR